MDKAPRRLKAPAHAVDIAVGRNLVAIRKRRGMSQSAVAEALGLTFQQVQKYERGSNRISASKLYDAAKALGVNVEDFFTGLARSDDNPHLRAIGPEFSKLETLDGGSELARAYADVGSPRRRRLILEMACELATPGSQADRHDVSSPEPQKLG